MDDGIQVRKDFHINSSDVASLEPIFEKREDLGNHSVYVHSLKIEIARSANGSKLQGPHVEYALTERFLCHKFW